jgi:stage V sporulation protein G
MNATETLPKLEAKVRLYHDAGGHRELLGFADLTIAEAFVIRSIRVLMSKPKEGRPGGPFISFPSRKGGQDKYFEIAHPITAEARQAAKESVLRAYEEESHNAGVSPF